MNLEFSTFGGHMTRMRSDTYWKLNNLVVKINHILMVWLLKVLLRLALEAFKVQKWKWWWILLYVFDYLTLNTRDSTTLKSLMHSLFPYICTYDLMNVIHLTTYVLATNNIYFNVSSINPRWKRRFCFNICVKCLRVEITLVSLLYG